MCREGFQWSPKVLWFGLEEESRVEGPEGRRRRRKPGGRTVQAHGGEEGETCGNFQ